MSMMSLWHHHDHLCDCWRVQFISSKIYTKTIKIKVWRFYHNFGKWNNKIWWKMFMYDVVLTSSWWRQQDRFCDCRRVQFICSEIHTKSQNNQN